MSILSLMSRVCFAVLACLWCRVAECIDEKMAKLGGIVLGIGGDNSGGGVGSFYEGALVAGFASNATDAAVHANIVAARYNISSRA